MTRQNVLLRYCSFGSDCRGNTDNSNRILVMRGIILKVIDLISNFPAVQAILKRLEDSLGTAKDTALNVDENSSSDSDVESNSNSSFTQKILSSRIRELELGAV